MRVSLGIKIGLAVFVCAGLTGSIGAAFSAYHALAAAAAGALVLGWLLSRPVRKMIHAARQIREHHYDVAIPSTFLASEEEQYLAEVLDRMARVVQESAEDMESIVELVTELKRAYQQLQKRDDILNFEMDLAARFQNGILPPTPFTHLGFHVVASYLPADKLGGDFYDLAVLPNQNLAVLIADVSGHGTPAAMITGLTKLSFMHAVHSVFDSPRSILDRLNHTITDVVRTQEFLTAFCMVIETDHSVSFCNAGHHLALVMRREERRLETWGREGMIIGMFADAAESFHEDRDRLNTGDRVLLYTDGFVEATNEKTEEFGIDRLKSLLVETMDLPVEDQQRSLLEAWHEFIGAVPPADDVCFLILELSGQTGNGDLAGAAASEIERMEELVADLE